MRFEIVDLMELARSRTADYVVGAREAGIDLGIEGDGQVLVRGDPMLLGELLNNLIENAIAYAGRGTDATVRVAAEGGGALLEMADNGKGVSEDQFALIRRRFSRGDEEKPGAGLGLPIVEEIAALFGGEVSLHTVQPHGFIVRVHFPRLPQQ
jgi:two-component system sensor histidine kinase TctE